MDLGIINYVSFILFWITHPSVHYPKENDICTIFQFYSPLCAWTASMFPFWSRHATWTFMEKIQETHFPLYLTPSFIYSSINLVIVDVYKFTIIYLMIFRLKTSSLIDFEGSNNIIRQYPKSHFWRGKNCQINNCKFRKVNKKN